MGAFSLSNPHVRGSPHARCEDTVDKERSPFTALSFHLQTFVQTYPLIALPKTHFDLADALFYFFKGMATFG